MEMLRSSVQIRDLIADKAGTIVTIIRYLDGEKLHRRGARSTEPLKRSDEVNGQWIGRFTEGGGHLEAPSDQRCVA